MKIAHGEMDNVIWHVKKPKECSDAYCEQEILEVIIEVTNTKKDESSKSDKNKKGHSLRGSLPKRNQK